MIFVWQSKATETSHIFVGCFLMVKIVLIYAEILLWTKMSRPLQNINLKIFCVPCCYSMQKICWQNWRGYWHRQFAWIFFKILFYESMHKRYSISPPLYLGDNFQSWIFKRGDQEKNECLGEHKEFLPHISHIYTEL